MCNEQHPLNPTGHPHRNKHPLLIPKQAKGNPSLTYIFPPNAFLACFRASPFQTLFHCRKCNSRNDQASSFPQLVLVCNEDPRTWRLQRPRQYQPHSPCCQLFPPDISRMFLTLRLPHTGLRLHPSHDYRECQHAPSCLVLK